MPDTTILVASAGTGKTTKLMDKLEELLVHVPPERIVFTTYTNAGADEAIARAVSRFGFDRDRFLHFRTLHSLCYRNIRRRGMMQARDYAEMGRSLGYPTTGSSALSARDGLANAGAARGDRLLTLDNLMRNRCCTAEEACAAAQSLREDASTLRHFSESYALYRREKGLIDFTDQLELFLSEGAELDIDYLMLDEAQDQSKLQWKVADRIASWAGSVYIAGDDKQAIYEFSGASPDSLIERTGDRQVLGTCYRLPSRVLAYAESIATRITKKTPYSVAPVAQGGSVTEIRSLREVDLSQGTWLLLARNRLFLEVFERELVQRGLVYKSQKPSLIPASAIPCIHAWNALLDGKHIPAASAKLLYRNFLATGPRVKRGFKTMLDAVPDDDLLSYEDLKETYGLRCDQPWDIAFSLSDTALSYLKAAERSGQLEDPDRIEVTTIHSTKGREADNVVVLPDMSWATWNEWRRSQDPEHRVFYVACSRARRSLFLHFPITDNFYPLPTPERQ